eukprot:CAMPEP_0183783832 /NCGR_PEP_ID=MMETSP0739-20130205/64506_1 /TAXON_ID=385413 /ORGANISM="Thalassiosira miniscula, Strain CCMP1093" /LENGTH=332 /DNA_ID=CAMNT_0026027615 /DNA_START=29 /DNA_END=1027 /DNA_ORIENTATION=-
MATSSVSGGSSVATACSSASASLSVSSAATASSPALPTRRMDNKKMISSPQEFFADMLRDRGYPATMVCSLKCGYHNSPTEHQTASYGVSLTKAIRSSDTSTASALLKAGLHPNACNKFGESIVHAACRRSDTVMLRTLIDAGSHVQVTDDFGRTPLHDACWTSSPNFDTIRLLLEEDPWLICVMDCRGSTPLGYVRKAHWALWIGFLGAIADRYWPVLDGPSDQRERVPPLGQTLPDSNPLPDPKTNVLDIDIVELLANGKLTPQDLEEAGSASELNQKPLLQKSTLSSPTVSCSRITLDPLRQMGSNATTMLKGSSQGMHSFVQVHATPH